MLSTGAQGNLDLLYVQQGDPKLHVKYVWQWELSQQFPPVVNGLRDGLVADLCKALWVNVGPAEQHLLFVNQRHEAVPYLGFFRGCEGAQVKFTHAHDCHGVGPREGVAARTTHVAKGVMARIVEFRPLPRDQSAATFPVLELLTGPHEGQHLLCPRKRLQVRLVSRTNIALCPAHSARQRVMCGLFILCTRFDNNTTYRIYQLLQLHVIAAYNGAQLQSDNMLLGSWCSSCTRQDQERIGRAALTAATQKAHRRRVALIRAALRWGEAASSTSFRGTQVTGLLP